MKCPYCDQIHPDNASFCPTTGKSIQHVEQEETAENNLRKPCPFCLKPVLPHVQFCPHCGFHFKSEIAQKSIISLELGRQKNRLPLYLLIGLGLVAGISLLVFGILFITQRTPQEITSFIKREKPTLQVLETIDITDFFKTPSPAADLAANTEITSQSSQVINSNEFTATPTIFNTVRPTLTVAPVTATRTIQNSPTATQPVYAVDIQINEKDQAEMVLIPAGEFLMGSDSETDPYFWGAEGPSHQVFIDGFLIYRNEVTNEMYQNCVTAGACPRPQKAKSRTRDEYYGNPDYADYPVIYVTYTSALSYCRWVGGRLPTEAEWERAARGDSDARLFPWGSTPAEENQANFCDQGCDGPLVDSNKNDGYRDTAPIGSYPEGVSPFGLYDTAGNVWEWVFDYFNAGYYQISPEKNPRGPQSSLHRAIRGGSWNNPSAGVRIVQRTGVKPEDSLDTLGFRCTVDPK